MIEAAARAKGQSVEDYIKDIAGKKRTEELKKLDKEFGFEDEEENKRKKQDIISRHKQLSSLERINKLLGKPDEQEISNRDRVEGQPEETSAVSESDTND